MEEISGKKTTIALSADTREKLKQFGKKGESYDKIMTRVMKKASSLSKNFPENDDVVSKENSK